LRVIRRWKTNHEGRRRIVVLAEKDCMTDTPQTRFVSVPCPRCGRERMMEWDTAADPDHANRLARVILCDSCRQARERESGRRYDWWRKLPEKKA